MNVPVNGLVVVLEVAGVGNDVGNMLEFQVFVWILVNKNFSAV